MKKILILICGILFTSAGWADTEPYDFPIADAYAATVIGTPKAYKAALPEKIRLKTLRLRVFEDRRIPDVFWYQDGLKYSLAYQKKRAAPLIFIIAGTGADYDSIKMRTLQKIFFNAGFHVISLPSPTHPSFIVNASTTKVPGHIIDDSRDLYRVMNLAWQQVKNKIRVSEFYLTGYSLGAAQAAFISNLDEEGHVFDFKKILLINPPVSLFNSVRILDDMLNENIPGGPDNFSNFFDEMMNRFTDIYKTLDYIDFDDDFLYKIYNKQPPSENVLPALIGLSFRLSSSNMVFTTDVMSNAGYVVPKNRKLTAASSLTDYFKVTNRINFMDYFHELFYPYFKSFNPDLTEQELLDDLSLKSIESYLQQAEKIALMTNVDDLILAPGEVDYLRRLFKARAKIYPRGGHCGNLDHKDNVAFMIDYFTN